MNHLCVSNEPFLKQVNKKKIKWFVSEEPLHRRGLLFQTNPLCFERTISVFRTNHSCNAVRGKQANKKQKKVTGSAEIA